MENGIIRKYCRIHRLISNCTPLYIWDCMRSGDDLDLIKKQLPEEFLKDYNEIQRIFTEIFNENIKILSKTVEKYKEWTDKELGLLLSDLEQRELFSPVERLFIFACRKSDFLKKVLTPGEERDRMFKFFRPKANVLEGYTPSSAMDRFESESL